MKVAGRKMVVSISMPGRPGRISSMAASTPLVTSRVLAQGKLSTISSRPGPSLIDGVADHRPGAFHHVGHIAQQQRLAIAARWRRRWAPAPGLPATRWTGHGGSQASDWGCRGSRRCRSSRRASTGSPRNPGYLRSCCMTSSSVTPLAASCCGSTCTCGISILLAPDRHIGHAAHAQQALADLPVGDHRQVDHRAALSRRSRSSSCGRWTTAAAASNGGAAQVGSVGVAMARRSATSLARHHQVGAWLEDQDDGRQLLNRLGAHDVQPRRAVEHLLQRHGDQGFHLGGRQAEARVSGSPRVAARTRERHPPASHECGQGQRSSALRRQTRPGSDT